MESTLITSSVHPLKNSDAYKDALSESGQEKWHGSNPPSPSMSKPTLEKIFFK